MQPPNSSPEHGDPFCRVFGGTSTPVFVLDPVNDRIVNANAAAAQMLGYAREELLRTPVSAIHPHDMSMLLGLAREVVEHRQPATREIHCLTRSGTRVPAEISATFVDAAEGIRIVALVRQDGALGPAPAAGGRIAELEQALHEREAELARLRAAPLEPPGEGRPQGKPWRASLDHGDAAIAGGELVGGSVALRGVIEAIERAAPTAARVLITGESGTGKELVARAIHARSLRGAAPLVRVNCAAVPRELFESEFFGHVKGAFTGAAANRPGRFELADGGTLLLDEVGEIPPALQGKLLRVLQDGLVERVGAAHGRRVDVRVVAATNRDLGAAVRRGEFRADLYYRLNVFPIHVPPLRERREDIALLAEHFVGGARRRLHRPELRLAPLDLARLEAYGWPGNVRELQNVIERAIILAGPGGRLPIELPEPCARGRRGGPRELPPCGFLTEAERRERDRRSIVAALEAAGGRIYGPAGAAALLGLKPSTLASRMKSLGIARPARSDGAAPHGTSA